MEEIRQVKVVSFDFGGTLAYEATDDSIILQQILQELGYKIEMDDIEEAMKNAREWWRREKGEKVWNEEAMREFHEKLLSELGIPYPERLAEKTSKILPRKLDFKAYDDAEQTLENLKRMGYSLIIISNVSSRRNLETYMEKAGLNGYFDALFASGSMGVEKPNPQIFYRAAKEMNVLCQAMVHIGDSYEIDYLGAENAGMMGILIDRKGNYRDKECRKISSLTQLLKLLTK